MKSKMKAKDLHQWHCGERSEAILLLLLLGLSSTGKFSHKHVLADKDMHLLHDDMNIVPSNKCCDWMKKKPFEKYAKEAGMKGCIQGIRMAEEGARDSAVKTRLFHGGKLCTWVKKGVIQKAPIIDWTDEDVWEFLNAEGCKSNPLYECGWKRVGCIGCPMASKAREREFEAYPRYRTMYLHAFDRMLKARADAGLDLSWNSAEEVFDWWMEKTPRRRKAAPNCGADMRTAREPANGEWNTAEGNDR